MRVRLPCLAICSTEQWPADPRTETIDTIRALAMDAVQKANAGHPGTAMALAPLAYLLYRDVLRHNPADPHWPGRDRFVLSAGHACILQYAVAPPRGLRPHARRPAAVPAVGLAHAGPPGVRAHRRHRDDDGAARPGIRERRRDGDRPALPRRSLQPAAPRDRRLVDLRDLLRRRPDGGDQRRGGVDRRPPRARPARLRLRRQPHHDRRHDLAHVHDRGQGQALRGVRLARPARRRLGGSRRAARRARGGEGRGGAPVADRSPQSHRLSGAARVDTGEGTRRPARRGRGPGDEGGHGLRSRRDLRRLGRRARAHGGRGRARAPSCRASGRAASPPGRARSRSSRRSASSTCAASRARAGARRCPCSRPARRSRRATPAAR